MAKVRVEEDSSGAEHQVKVRNLSSGGMMAEGKREGRARFAGERRVAQPRLGRRAPSPGSRTTASASPSSKRSMPRPCARRARPAISTRRASCARRSSTAFPTPPSCARSDRDHVPGIECVRRRKRLRLAAMATLLPPSRATSPLALLAGCLRARERGRAASRDRRRQRAIRSRTACCFRWRGQHVRAATTEGLVGLDAQGEVIPALADRWIVTDDGKSYIFRLRDGTWADGQELTGESARDALRRAVRRLAGTSIGYDVAQIGEIRAMARARGRDPPQGPDARFPATARPARTGPDPQRPRDRADEAAARPMARRCSSMMPPEKRGLPNGRGLEGPCARIAGPGHAGEARGGAVWRRRGRRRAQRHGSRALPLVDTGPLSRGTVRLDPALGLFGLLGAPRRWFPRRPVRARGAGDGDRPRCLARAVQCRRLDPDHAHRRARPARRPRHDRRAVGGLCRSSSAARRLGAGRQLDGGEWRQGTRDLDRPSRRSGQRCTVPPAFERHAGDRDNAQPRERCVDRRSRTGRPRGPLCQCALVPQSVPLRPSAAGLCSSEADTPARPKQPRRRTLPNAPP